MTSANTRAAVARQASTLASRAAEALADMLKARQMPKDPQGYQSTGVPWPATCMDCGRDTAPQVNSLRNGQGGCRFCGNERRVAALRMAATALAEKDARRSGFVPLEAFQHTKHRWRLLHVACARETRMRVNDIRNALAKGNVRECWECRNETIGRKRSFEEAEAVAIALRRNKRPLVPYPGANEPWKCECLDCGAVVYPRFGKLNSRDTGNCSNCGPVAAAAKQLADNGGQAAADMLAAGFEPLEDYPGTSRPWKSRHLCGREVRPRLSNIRAGTGGCRECGFEATAAKLFGDPAVAVADMRAAGFEPLEDYPGVVHPWRCVHLRCEREVSPRLNSIRNGQGGCRECFPGGFQHGKPGLVYVLMHYAFGAVKVGITGTATSRLADFRSIGWTVVRTYPFEVGGEAYGVEQSVHAHLRDDRGLIPFLTAEQMPYGGWTETYDARLVSALELMSIVEAEIGERVAVA
ncbi:GIY-YIG nuclease family protein [Streptomyces sp. AP-93]|uniref:GIY-YIG nuclease family protein n=1 Tax=Streptomyces sp. AP-93 TaxID=2929048 RepID=UPI001FB039C1|nr:GIY-YIG nuclease family protein [Streptomyces sp. AP-93]MCJ0868123.1 GIY-YIG nuclease family protein [Streptomyces sp. AP-93]